MENIFENAYFGKIYRTKDGRKAAFVNWNGIKTKVFLYVKERDMEFYGEEMYDLDGTTSKGSTLHDIVSEWNEEINEEEYENKIKSLINSCIYWESYESEPELFAKSLKELLDFASKDKRTIDYCADLIKSRKTILEEVNNNIKSIISKEINEEKLDKLATTFIKTREKEIVRNPLLFDYKDAVNIFKAGYRKAKLELCG